MSLRRRHQIRKTVARNRREMRPWPARVGDGNGTIEVPGQPNLWYVREWGSELPIPVYRGSAPRQEGYPVWVGQDVYNKRWLRILGIDYERAVNGGITVTEVGPHAEDHLYNGSDPVYIDVRQVVNVLAYASSGMTVHVNAGWVIIDGQPVKIIADDIDMTSSIPASGAAYSIIRADNTGALTVVDGTPVASLIDLDDSDAPAFADGYAAIALIRLWDGMTELSRSSASPDVTPLYLAQISGLGSGAIDLTRIFLVHEDGSETETFDPDSTGLTNALGAAAAGDLVVLPVDTITGGPWTVPADVELSGVGESSILDGDITVTGILSDTVVTGTISGTGIIRLVSNTTGEKFSEQIVSTLATGTAPLSIASTTLITNLNADLLDGYHAAEIAGASELDDLSDVDTTGKGVGDIIYNNAGTWEDYPLGIGSKITVDGNDLRFGNVSGGNYINIDASTGNLRLNGDATQWDDLRLSGSSARVGVTAPSVDAFGPSGSLRTLRFEEGHHDEIYFEIQMPHAWKEGSDIYPHVHWSPVTTEAGNVVWQLDYTWANVNEAFAAPTTMTTDATAAGGTAWIHKLSAFKDGSSNTYIDGAGKTLSSMLVMRLHRDAGAGSDTLSEDVAFLEFDIHYEVDSFGSDEEYIKDASAALLLESGDYFLLENGDNLLLE